MTVIKETNYIEGVVQICFVIHCSYIKRVEHLFSVAEKAKKRCRVFCIRTLLRTPLCSFLCIWSTLGRVCLLYTALKSTIIQCHYLNFLHQFLRDLVTHNFRSLRMMTLHLMFTANDWNICVTRPECFFFCIPYFGRRFPLISSLLFLFLEVCFLRRAHQNSGSFPRMLHFCWLFLFPTKVIWNRANVREVNNDSGVFWGRHSDCWLGSMDLCR